MSKSETRERNRQIAIDQARRGLTTWETVKEDLAPVISLVQWGGVAVTLLLLGKLVGLY